MQKKLNLHSERTLFEIAKLYYEERKTQEAIASEFNTSKATVNRLLEEAREKEIVKVQVINRMSHDSLRDLETKLKNAFNLQDVWLVPGRKEILDDTISDNAREALLYSITSSAATYLDSQLSDKDILCIARGRVMSYVIENIKPYSYFTNLKFVPMLGVLSLQRDDFDAAFLVSRAANVYASEYYTLPVPAIGSDISHKNAVKSLPLVNQVLDLIEKSTIAITTISPADPDNATIRKTGIIAREVIGGLIKEGAIGEIGFWFFNSNGDEIKTPHYYSLGLGLEGLKRMVKQNKKVIAVVGAHKNRIKPIFAASMGKIFNILITDHVTANELLKMAKK